MVNQEYFFQNGENGSHIEFSEMDFVPQNHLKKKKLHIEFGQTLKLDTNMQISFFLNKFKTAVILDV